MAFSRQGAIANYAKSVMQQSPGPPLDPDQYQMWQGAQQIVEQAGGIDDIRTIGCWYAASAAIGGLGVADGMGALLPELSEDAGVGTLMLYNLGKKGVDWATKGLAAGCGYEAIK